MFLDIRTYIHTVCVCVFHGVHVKEVGGQPVASVFHLVRFTDSKCHYLQRSITGPSTNVHLALAVGLPHSRRINFSAEDDPQSTTTKLGLQYNRLEDKTGQKYGVCGVMSWLAA